jgi:hypothetical protein
LVATRSPETTPAIGARRKVPSSATGNGSDSASLAFPMAMRAAPLGVEEPPDRARREL